MGAEDHQRRSEVRSFSANPKCFVFSFCRDDWLRSSRIKRPMAAALARHCPERGIVKHLCRRPVRALLPRNAPLRSALPWLRHVGRGRRCLMPCGCRRRRYGRPAAVAALSDWPGAPPRRHLTATCQHYCDDQVRRAGRLSGYPRGEPAPSE